MQPAAEVDFPGRPQYHASAFLVRPPPAAIGSVSACSHPSAAAQSPPPWFAALLPWGRIAFARCRRLRAFEKALPHAIDMMARSLRAGHSTAAAIEIMAQGAPEPACTEFSEVFRQQNFGLPSAMPSCSSSIAFLPRPPRHRHRHRGATRNRRQPGRSPRSHDPRHPRTPAHPGRNSRADRPGPPHRLDSHPASRVVMGPINVMDPGYSKPLLNDPFGHKLLMLCGLLIVWEPSSSTASSTPSMFRERRIW